MEAQQANKERGLRTLKSATDKNFVEKEVAKVIDMDIYLTSKHQKAMSPADFQNHRHAANPTLLKHLISFLRKQGLLVADQIRTPSTPSLLDEKF